MSKIIKMTPEVIEELKGEFEECLEKIKLSDGKFSFSKTLGQVERKANLYFKEMAWCKMWALIDDFDKEVAWHGVARRGDDPEKDEYIIEDILVYPQEVTGATVNTDQEKYQMWLMTQEDEIFNNIRMQGHSHVNMGVSPSTVDDTLYEQILDQLEDDMFYIFLIFNKSGKMYAKIYDLAKNVLFETSDIEIFTLDDGTGLRKFLEEARELVEDKKYPPATTKTNNENSGGTYPKKKKSNGGTYPQKKKSNNGGNGGYGYDYGYSGYNWGYDY